ncbi:outer membrane beta-barrel family protein [Croceivirga thetidis]|uniref:TonB-dependent receptor n=1 Tax=Croceivirga thetidis TaxID=2721623 RepID=A0ABX1GKW2_9FLAO|nr:outer membrane beta-barrel family protein [Croceivirga thetidis]NKI30489.1 TonB-dependent receptor [Croceivirga thetidis]
MKYLALVFFLVSFFTSAQQVFQLTGNVLDTNGNAVPVGDVLLLDLETKNVLKYTTLLEGYFIFEDIASGEYFLEISALGFQKHRKQIVIPAITNVQIQLNENTTQLNEVELIAAKNPIEYQNGNLKVDVQNPYFSSIPDPMDLLSRLPNIQVSADRESISILGKGNPLLYLGNQRISIEEFNTLPIDGIETIELINNPSAKYEAEGRAVILVRLMQDFDGGFQGSTQETVSQRRNFNNYLALNSSYSTKNWTVRGNLGYNQLLQWESNSFLFEIPEREVLVDYLVRIPRNVRTQINPSFGVYNQWNENDYISLNASARLQTDNAPFFTDTFIVDRGEEQSTETETDNDNSKDYYSASFNFNKKLSDSWNIFTGLQYSGFRQTLGTEISNSINGGDFILDQTRNQEYSINSLAFRLDFEKIFSANLKWEWGTNISLANADALTEIIRDVTTEVDFEYQEDLYAVYSSFSGSLGEKINFELGARLEHNEVDSAADNDAVPVISRINTSLFPKANVSITIDSTKTLSLNYARNINRQDFSRASSITVFINPFLEGAGNVNLRPTFTDEFSANFQKGKTSFYATFYQSTNPTNFTISYDEEMDTAILSLVNLEKEIGFYTGVTVPYTKGIWTSNNTLNVIYSQIQDNTAVLGETRPVFYAYTNQQFKTGKDVTLAFGGYAISRSQQGIFERNARISLEASISKTFFKNWDCTLRFNDITRGTNFKESYTINGVIADGVYFTDLREAALSIKYRFGNQDKVKFKNKDVDGNIDRIR